MIAAQRVFTCTEAQRCNPEGSTVPAHDAYTRLLGRYPPDSEGLWKEVIGCVRREEGSLWIDDSTLDKPYARKMELVSRHWSGKHGRVVQGINLITLLWSDSHTHLPCDYRLYDKDQDGLTKNDHFLAMIESASKRGFQPKVVGFDSWYSSLKNLKAIRDLKWTWLTQLRCNRQVDLDRSGNRRIDETPIGRTGQVVHLKGYGMIKVFKMAASNGGIDYWATNDLEMDMWGFAEVASQHWKIEDYHRAIKQYCGVERCQHRKATAQRNHIGFALRAYLRLECHRFNTGVSWFEAKQSIVRNAIAQYRASPLYSRTSLESA